MGCATNDSMVWRLIVPVELSMLESADMNKVEEKESTKELIMRHLVEEVKKFLEKS